MNWGDIQQYLIGGGGLIAIISWWGTQRSNKNKTRLDLVDRLYREIERMDERVTEVEADNKLLRATNQELNTKVLELQRCVSLLEGGKPYDK